MTDLSLQRGLRTIKKPPDEPESTLQKRIVAWCKARGYPCLSFRQSPKVKGIITPGWPDLTIAMEAGRTLYIELKRRKGSYLSDKQKSLALMLKMCGHEWYIVKTFKEFEKIINRGEAWPGMANPIKKGGKGL